MKKKKETKKMLSESELKDLETAQLLAEQLRLTSSLYRDPLPPSMTDMYRRDLWDLEYWEICVGLQKARNDMDRTKMPTPGEIRRYLYPMKLQTLFSEMCASKELEEPEETA